MSLCWVTSGISLVIRRQVQVFLPVLTCFGYDQAHFTRSCMEDYGSVDDMSLFSSSITRVKSVCN
ncbi:hypothetical protein Peur_067653 [Populus x canadensis]